MPDLDLREFERRALCGDPRARAGLLRTRLRQGTLQLGRLQLAAHLGDPGACAALGDEAPQPFTSLEGFLRRAAIFGRDPWGRAAVAAAWVAVAAWEAPTQGLARNAERFVASCQDRLGQDAPQTPKRLGAQAKQLPPSASFLRALGRAIGEDATPTQRWARTSIRESAAVAGEAPVREAIVEALIEWALSG